jgi:hypothetical protein
MPRYQDKDILFEAPKDWTDRTIVAFSAPLDATKNKETAPNIVMTREPMRDEDTLRTHADRQLLELGRQLKDFDLLESRETELAGLPAIFLRYTWVSHLGELEQSLTMVERRLPEGRVAATFTTTVGKADAANARPVLNQILQNVRFEPSGPPRPSGPAGPPPPPIAEPSAPIVPMPGTRGPSSRR